MRMPISLAALACSAGLACLAGCAPMGVRGSTVTMTNNGYQPPPGAIPAPTTAQAGLYDYSGIVRTTLDGVPVTPFDALNATVARNALVLGQVTAVPDPIRGRLHIVIPDHDRLRLLSLQRNRGVSGSLVEFQTEMERIGLHETADTVVRAGVFTAADILEQNDTSWPDGAGADDVLWYQVQSVRPNNAGPWVGSWQMRRAEGSANLAVTFDPGTAPGPARLLSFARSVHEVDAALRGAPASLAAAPPGVRRGGHPVSNGSGIVVDAAGQVLTDNHVISGCLDIRVTGAGGTVPAAARLVANDAKLDLALLRTGQSWPGVARFRGSQSLRPGETLVATGFPLTGLVSPEMAVTTGSLTTLSGGPSDDRVFQFSAPVQPGNSGGPVLDGSGRVVGVTKAVLNGLAVAILTGGAMPQNVNFATKADIARDYLGGLGVRLSEGGAGGGTLDAASIGEMARAFTVKVECWR